MNGKKIYYDKRVGVIGPFFSSRKTALAYCRRRSQYCTHPEETALDLFARMGTLVLDDESEEFVVDWGEQ